MTLIGVPRKTASAIEDPIGLLKITTVDIEITLQYILKLSRPRKEVIDMEPMQP